MKLSDIVSPHLSPRKKRGRLLFCVGSVVAGLARAATGANERGGGALEHFAAAGGSIAVLVGLYYLLTKDPPPPIEPDATEEPLPEPYTFTKRFVPLEDEPPAKRKKKKRRKTPAAE